MVAEGVEDQITCDVLAGFGCDIAQGYHLARPMPAAQLAHWLEQRTTLARGELFLMAGERGVHLQGLDAAAGSCQRTPGR